MLRELGSHCGCRKPRSSLAAASPDGSAEGVADYRRQETRVTASRVTPTDAEHLGCPRDAVVLVTDSVNCDPDDTPIQLSRARFLAERIELVFRT